MKKFNLFILTHKQRFGEDKFVFQAPMDLIDILNDDAADVKIIKALEIEFSDTYDEIDYIQIDPNAADFPTLSKNFELIPNPNPNSLHHVSDVIAVLKAEYDQRADGFWGQHPKWPMENWQHEVGNGNTRLSYWEWVLHNLESEARGAA